MPLTKRILVLDDHVDLLDIVREVLVYENYEVKGISCNAEVISTAQAYQPDLIIMDCHPECNNGKALCKAVKDDIKLNHIPVIISSAYLGADTPADTFGCDAIIAKPYNLTQLVNTVNTLLVHKPTAIS